MKKRYAVLIVGLFVAGLLAGCGSTATTAPTQEALPVATEAQPTAAPAVTEAVSPTEAPVSNVPTLPPTSATPALSDEAPGSADDLLEVSPQELKAMIEGGADIAIVDAQPAEAYAIGHIKGAVNVPWAMQISGSGGLPFDKLLIVYCACEPDAAPSATDSGDVAMQLITNFGYTKVAVLAGGWVQWQELGYPTGD